MADDNSIGHLWRSSRLFLRNFSAYAGAKGVQAAVLVVFGAFLEGLSLILIVPLLGVVAAPTGGRLQTAAEMLFRLAGAASRFEKLALLLGLFGIMMLVRALVLSRRDIMLAQLQVGFVEAQRARVIRHLSTARWERLVQLRHARITHLMSGDIQRIGIAAHFLLQCGVAAMMLLAQCVLAFLLSPGLAAIAFALLVIGGLAVVPMLRKARALGTYMTGANLQLLNTTSQFLGGLKLAISQNLQASFADEFLDTLHNLTERQITFTRQQTNSRLAFATISALVGAVVMLLGVGILNLPPAILITLLLILARMNGPATQVQQGAQQLANNLPAYDKIMELEAELATVADTTEATDPIAPLANGPIAFHDVSFTHDTAQDRPAGVNGLSLTLAPSCFVGIAGPSGSGKTTFADLMVGLYPPQTGRITVGGRPLTGPALIAWRDRIGYVAQDAFLFHDTVRRNLAWARPGVGEEDMWHALALAGADEIVRRMTHGLDTIVGERGTLVSGGERQRIALARAILRRPQLLVLDEATNAIDIAGERLIVERLLAMDPRPAIVMIAHRAESLHLCDRILSFSDGRITAVQDRHAQMS